MNAKNDAANPAFSGMTEAFATVGIHPLGHVTPAEPEPLLNRRRAFFSRQESPFVQMSLIRGPDGALRWHDGAPGARGYSLRRAGRAAVPAGAIEQQFIFQKLHEPSQVSATLETLDEKLTDVNRRDLWRWTKAGWVRFPPDQAGSLSGKNVLLFIHGTFSHCDKIFEDLLETGHGKAFLQYALAKYDLVLAFNHPTLGVSPAVNALKLAACLRDVNGPPASVDVICHSRGGLVTRWWLEGFADPRPQYRAVFVASPLGGTNLAAPPRLKGALDFLTNVADVLGTGAKLSGFPIAQFVGGVIRIINSIAKLAIHSPALDAAVAAIPGLAAQSRVGNNPELNGLRSAGAWRGREYYAVLSDFRPPSGDKWKFWRVFCDPTSFALSWADKAADLVFVERKSPGAPLELSPNDLVVDCSSMTDLSDTSQSKAFKDRLHFESSNTIMHTNYFLQRQVLDFVVRSFPDRQGKKT
jgi:hypothetical protein